MDRGPPGLQRRRPLCPEPRATRLRNGEASGAPVSSGSCAGQARGAGCLRSLDSVRETGPGWLPGRPPEGPPAAPAEHPAGPSTEGKAGARPGQATSLSRTGSGRFAACRRPGEHPAPPPADDSLKRGASLVLRAPSPSRGDSARLRCPPRHGPRPAPPPLALRCSAAPCLLRALMQRRRRQRLLDALGPPTLRPPPRRARSSPPAMCARAAAAAAAVVAAARREAAAAQRASGAAGTDGDGRRGRPPGTPEPSSIPPQRQSVCCPQRAQEMGVIPAGRAEQNVGLPEGDSPATLAPTLCRSSLPVHGEISWIRRLGYEQVCGRNINTKLTQEAPQLETPITHPMHGLVEEPQSCLAEEEGGALIPTSGLLQVAECRQPLSSVSSLEVHFDLLDLTELTDMSDQELAEVFADSDEENVAREPTAGLHPHSTPRAGYLRSPSWTRTKAEPGHEKKHLSDPELQADPFLAVEKPKEE